MSAFCPGTEIIRQKQASSRAECKFNSCFLFSSLFCLYRLKKKATTYSYMYLLRYIAYKVQIERYGVSRARSRYTTQHLFVVLL